MGVLVNMQGTGRCNSHSKGCRGRVVWGAGGGGYNGGGGVVGKGSGRGGGGQLVRHSIGHCNTHKVKRGGGGGRGGRGGCSWFSGLQHR